MCIGTRRFTDLDHCWRPSRERQLLRSPVADALGSIIRAARTRGRVRAGRCGGAGPLRHPPGLLGMEEETGSLPRFTGPTEAAGQGGGPGAGPEGKGQGKGEIGQRMKPVKAMKRAGQDGPQAVGSSSGLKSCINAVESGGSLK